MRKTFYFVFAVVMFGLFAFLIYSLVAQPRAVAMGWYDFECCSEKDCRQTTLGEVERHKDGWYVVPLKVTLPFDDPRVRRSLDPLIHICLIPAGILNDKPAGLPTLRCLYVPEVAG